MSRKEHKRLALEIMARLAKLADSGGGKVVLWIHPSGDVAPFSYTYGGEDFEELWKCVKEEYRRHQP